MFVVTDVVVPESDTGAGPAWYVEALRQWEEAATCAGITVSESSYDYLTATEDTEEGEACGAVRIGQGWYVVELHASEISARHIYDVENDQNGCGE